MNADELAKWQGYFEYPPTLQILETALEIVHRSVEYAVTDCLEPMLQCVSDACQIATDTILETMKDIEDASEMAVWLNHHIQVPECNRTWLAKYGSLLEDVEHFVAAPHETLVCLQELGCVEGKLEPALTLAILVDGPERDRVYRAMVSSSWPIYWYSVPKALVVPYTDIPLY